MQGRGSVSRIGTGPSSSSEVSEFVERRGAALGCKHSMGKGKFVLVFQVRPRARREWVFGWHSSLVWEGSGFDRRGSTGAGSEWRGCWLCG